MNWNSEDNQRLVKALLALENPVEVRSFLRDLMTEGEIAEFSKRLAAACMLSKDTSYAIIEKETGLSSTTVARVSKWLNEGENGYKTVISKLEHHASSQPRKGLS